MSLDVSLYRKYHVSYDGGKTLEEKEECVYDANITHNLGAMAAEAGIYQALWRPEELEITKANELIDPLEKGLKDLKEKPEYYEKFNSPNGWGLYEHFVPFVEKYLENI
jgi:hypothetical protein